MAKQIDDGGPAFPRPSGPEPRVNAATDYQEGMTLRDWFAGQALAAASDGADFLIRGDSESGYDVIAREAYRIADAMLAERAKRGAP